MINVKRLFERDYYQKYIYLYVFCLPIETFGAQMRVLSILLLIWWLYLGKKEGYFIKLREIVYSKPLILFFVALSYFYISIFWSSDIQDGLNITARLYKYYWLVVPILFSSLNFEEAKKALLIFTLSMLFYALFSFLIHIGVLSGFGKGTTRDNPVGLYKYTVISYYMIFGVIFSFFYYVYNNGKKYKYLFILGLFLSFYMLIIVNGRSAKITFLLTIMLLFLVNIKFFNSFKKFFLIILGILIFIFSVYCSSDVEKKFELGIHELQTFNIESNYKGSWRERLLMMNVGLDIIKNNLIFGAGGNDNIKYFHNYIDVNHLKIHKYWNLHNLHIELLSKYGIVGYMLFLSSILTLLYSLRKQKLYFQLAITYFGVVILSGIGDPLIYLEPHNDIYGMLFAIFSVIALKAEEELA